MSKHENQVLPVEVTALPISEAEVRRRNQYRSGIWVEEPAMGVFTALGTKRFEKVNLSMGHQTDRPTNCMIVNAPDGNGFYLIPGLKHEQSLDVRYEDGRAVINLIKLFTLLEKRVPSGLREFYPLEYVKHPVRFEGQEYRALWLAAKRTATKRIKSSKPKRGSRARKSVAKSPEVPAQI